MQRTEYLTLAEAAERLGVHPRTVRRRIATGELTGYRLGTKTVRVEASQLEQLLRRIPSAASA